MLNVYCCASWCQVAPNDTLRTERLAAAKEADIFSRSTGGLNFSHWTWDFKRAPLQIPMAKISYLGFGSCPWHPGTFKGATSRSYLSQGYSACKGARKVEVFHSRKITKDGWRKPGDTQGFFGDSLEVGFFGVKNFGYTWEMVEAPKTPAVWLKIFSARSRGSLYHLNRQRVRPVGSLHLWFIQKNIGHLERKRIFQTSMMILHVNLQGCNMYNMSSCSPSDCHNYLKKKLDIISSEAKIHVNCNTRWLPRWHKGDLLS